MKDSDSKETEFVELSQERLLNEQIKQLPQAQATPIDLWPEIKSAIVRPETKYYTARWIPWAIAASLVVSLVSVTYSWNSLQQAKSLYAKIENAPNELNVETNNSSLQKAALQNVSYENSLQYQVNQLEQEFKIAKAGLLSQISMNRAHIDKKLFLEIENQLVDIEQAVVLLKSAIKEQPDNTNLPKLLTTTYQQELAVLTQLAKLDTSI